MRFYWVHYKSLSSIVMQIVTSVSILWRKITHCDVITLNTSQYRSLNYFRILRFFLNNLLQFWPIWLQLLYWYSDIDSKEPLLNKSENNRVPSRHKRGVGVNYNIWLIPKFWMVFFFQIQKCSLVFLQELSFVLHHSIRWNSIWCLLWPFLRKCLLTGVSLYGCGFSTERMCS